MKSIKKKNKWFKPVRWSYLPVSWQAWLLYVPFVTFLLWTFYIVDSGSNSSSDTLLGIFPYWVGATAVMHWIASHTS